MSKHTHHHTLQVSKAVYASTTKSQLNLNKQRANESQPALTYPDISFAVENFEEAFESLVMSRLQGMHTHCYITDRDIATALAVHVHVLQLLHAHSNASEQDVAGHHSGCR